MPISPKKKRARGIKDWATKDKRPYVPSGTMSHPIGKPLTITFPINTGDNAIEYCIENKKTGQVTNITIYPKK